MRKIHKIYIGGKTETGRSEGEHRGACLVLEDGHVW